MFFPSTAALIQHKIGASHAWGFDLAGACSGFTFALATASQLVSTGRHHHALVVGADVMSSIIDYQDRATCVLFGDGAGAVVVSAGEGSGAGHPRLRPRDRRQRRARSCRCRPAAASGPRPHETVDQRLHYVKQDGQAVFKFAVRKTEEISRLIMQRNDLTADDIDLFVSHQANRRIITGRRPTASASPESKVMINLRALRQHDRRHHPARAHRRDRARAG